MDIFHIVGMVLIIAVIVGMAVYSGTKAKKAGNTNGAGIVAGVIMGTLVGGSSTVGTAQLAYNYGMSAWWFTLGAGIDCLVLALVFAKPFRASGTPTLVGMIRKEYGEKVGFAASILNSVGTFINIISQLLAASAVILVFVPDAPVILTVAFSAVVMVLYVIFGGTKSAGMVGVVKLILLYVAMVVCGILALSLAGGASSLMETVRGFCEETGVNYFSLVARGAGKDIGSGLSLLLGVLTTQTYAQGILSGKSDRTAVTGGLISAFLIPPIGVFGILVGLYMRSVTDPTVFVAKTALTQFVLDHLPPLFGGVVLGTLFIASVGTGAGLALGISTIVGNDIVKKFTRRFDDPKRFGLLTRVLIVAVLALACSMSTGALGDTILNFAFMSMGLRGAVVFVPLCCALWLKGKIDGKFAFASVIVGPVIVLLFGTVFAGVLPFDALFVGILASLVIMGAGYAAGKGRKAL